MNLSKRYLTLEPYFFAKLAEEKSAARKKGRDIIDLSIGDPDLEPPKILIEELKKILDEKRMHGYPSYIGTEKFRNAVCDWLKRRHDVIVDPYKELTGLIGSKEGLAHFLLATVDDGDYVVTPSPHYPMYLNAIKMAGGIPYIVTLDAKQDFLPDLNSVPDEIWSKTKVLMLNYPHNPTSATASFEFWKMAVEKAHKHNFIICSDAAYIEIYDGSDVPLSLLSIDGAKEIGVEFHSLSKTFSIPGWRLAFMAGNEELISATRKMKQSIDSGQFEALDLATAHLLKIGDTEVDGIRAIYAERRRYMVGKLKELGFEVFSKPATLYIWAKLQNKISSFDYFRMLLDKANVAVTPGITFGKEADNYIRFSLTSPRNRLEEAVQRLAKL